MVLVTGGTGLIGSHLLLHLCRQQFEVRAIYRDESGLQQVRKIFSYYHQSDTTLFDRIQWVSADITDIPAMQQALKGISKVYHAAALVSFDPRDGKRLMKINVTGTANIVNLCLSCGVEKLAYVSSIGSLGKTNRGGKRIREDDDWDHRPASHYAISKHLAEMEVWRASQEGLSVVIVNPGIVLGPGFWDKGSGKIIKMGMKSRGFYPPGGTGFIGVGDVAQILIELMESEVKGERFVLVSQNLSYKELFEQLSRATGGPFPRRKLGKNTLELLWRLDWLKSLLTGAPRKITKGGVKSLTQPVSFDNSKLVNFLDRPLLQIPEVIEFAADRLKQEQPGLFQ